MLIILSSVQFVFVQGEMGDVGADREHFRVWCSAELPNGAERIVAPCDPASLECASVGFVPNKHLGVYFAFKPNGYLDKGDAAMKVRLLTNSAQRARRGGA